MSRKRPVGISCEGLVIGMLLVAAVATAIAAIIQNSPFFGLFAVLFAGAGLYCRRSVREIPSSASERRTK